MGNNSRREKVKENVRNYRKKIFANENLKQSYLKKSAENSKKYRLKKKQKVLLNKKLKDEIKENERERKRNYRKKKKMEKMAAEDKIRFKSAQSLGKAVKKANKSLPQQAEKKVAVISKLLTLIDPNLKITKSDDEFLRPSIWNKLSLETVKVIENFYLREDISRVSPCLKDRVKIKTIDGTSYEQKRHMLFTIREAYAIFIEEYPDIDIKLSKFYELRPKFVMLTSEMPHNVCVCKYHANLFYLLSALSKELQTISSDHKKVLSEISCDTTNENCMMNECTDCKEIDVVFSSVPLAFDKQKFISVKQWKAIEGKTKLFDETNTVDTVIQMLQNQLPFFRKHHFIKNVQQKYFDFRRNNIGEGDTVLQIDFAENFSLVCQDEIQSAHWQHGQVTIFTGVAWLFNTTLSFALISDYLTHDKHSVNVFIKKILSSIISQGHKIQNLYVFSDGCAAQFKNRFTLSAICSLAEEYNLINVEWNFFASSHGKGAVDGVGAMVKRKVSIFFNLNKYMSGYYIISCRFFQIGFTFLKYYTHFRCGIK